MFLALMCFLPIFDHNLTINAVLPTRITLTLLSCVKLYSWSLRHFRNQKLVSPPQGLLKLGALTDSIFACWQSNVMARPLFGLQILKKANPTLNSTSATRPKPYIYAGHPPNWLFRAQQLANLYITQQHARCRCVYICRYTNPLFELPPQEKLNESFPNNVNQPFYCNSLRFTKMRTSEKMEGNSRQLCQLICLAPPGFCKLFHGQRLW